MDPSIADFLGLSRRASIVSIAVSLWYLIQLWRARELWGAQEAIFGLWFATAVLVQMLATSLWLWIAGLVAQVLLAVVLIVKKRMDDII